MAGPVSLVWLRISRLSTTRLFRRCGKNSIRPTRRLRRSECRTGICSPYNVQTRARCSNEIHERIRGQATSLDSWGSLRTWMHHRATADNSADRWVSSRIRARTSISFAWPRGCRHDHIAPSPQESPRSMNRPSARFSGVPRPRVACSLSFRRSTVVVNALLLPLRAARQEMALPSSSKASSATSVLR